MPTIARGKCALVDIAAKRAATDRGLDSLGPLQHFFTLARLYEPSAAQAPFGAPLMRTQLNDGKAMSLSSRAVGQTHRFPRRTMLGGLALALGAMRSASASPAIRIGGTGSALATMQLIAASFRDAHPGLGIEVLPSLGTSGGLRALQAGVIDIAVAARSLVRREREIGLQGSEYARTPLVFATGLDIGVQNISCETVAQIYAGELSEWPDGTPVRLIRRPPTEADWEALGGLSPAMARAVELAIRRPGLVTAASDQDNADAIESVRGSFGLISLGQILAERRRLTPFSLEGVGPADALAALDRWRLVRRLHIVTRAAGRAEARAFAEFVLGSAAGTVLAACGHAPVGELGG